MNHNTATFYHFPGIFRLYDCDKDGYISRKEMEFIVESMHKMVGHLVEATGGEEEDEDEDQLPQKRVDKIFKIMDEVRSIKMVV